jgi:hypothetical protein
MVVLLGLLLLCVLLHGQVAESAAFTVGDSGGWTINSNSWTNGKRFKAGDVIGTVMHDRDGETLLNLVATIYWRDEGALAPASHSHLISYGCIVFKYDSSAHNVVPVNAAGYNGCTAPSGAKVYKSGNDRGTNYFICSIPGHCQSGMKIAVNAAA